MLLLALSAAFAAEPEPIASGEFRNTAFTLAPGAVTLHPLLPTHVGLSDRVDLKFPILGQIGGPRASVEVGLLQQERVAVSIEPYGAINWGFRSGRGGATARFSAVVGAGQVNLNAGAYRGRFYDATDPDEPRFVPFFGAPLNLGYDLPLGDRDVVRIVGETDVSLLAYGTTQASVAASWNHAFGDVRLALGVAGFVGWNPIQEVLDGLAVAATVPPVVPTFEIWWRI